MDCRKFGLGTMVAILAPWVDPARNRPVLEGIAPLAPFLDQFDPLYAELCRMSFTEADLPRPLRALSLRAQLLEEVYDRKLTGICSVLNSVISLTESAAQAKAFTVLRDDLFPNGGSGQNEAFLSEANYVYLAEMRLTPKRRSLLAAITYGDRTLLDDFNDWVAAGKSLGALEVERAGLMENRQTTVTLADIRSVRARWHRLVNLLIEILAVSKEVDDETRIRLLFPLKRAEEMSREKTHLLDDYDEGELLELSDLDIDAAMATLSAELMDSREPRTGTSP